MVKCIYIEALGDFDFWLVKTGLNVKKCDTSTVISLLCAPHSTCYCCRKISVDDDLIMSHKMSREILKVCREIDNLVRLEDISIKERNDYFDFLWDQVVKW